MKIFSLVEMFELTVDGFSLSYVWFDGNVLLIFFCDEGFEFLLYLQLSHSYLEAICVAFCEFRQILGNLLVCVKMKVIFWIAKAQFKFV